MQVSGSPGGYHDIVVIGVIMNKRCPERCFPGFKYGQAGICHLFNKGCFNRILDIFQMAFNHLGAVSHIPDEIPLIRHPAVHFRQPFVYSCQDLTQFPQEQKRMGAYRGNRFSGQPGQKPDPVITFPAIQSFNFPASSGGNNPRSMDYAYRAGSAGIEEMQHFVLQFQQVEIFIRI